MEYQLSIILVFFSFFFFYSEYQFFLTKFFLKLIWKETFQIFYMCLFLSVNFKIQAPELHVLIISSIIAKF